MNRALFLLLLLPFLLYSFDYKPIILKIYKNNAILISRVYTKKRENSFVIKIPYNIQMSFVDITSSKCKVVHKSFLSNSNILLNDVEYGIKKLKNSNNRLREENSKELKKNKANNSIIVDNLKSIKKNIKSIAVLNKKLNNIALQKDLIVNFSCKNNNAHHDFFVKYFINVKNHIGYKIYANLEDKTLNIQSNLMLNFDKAYGKNINVFYYSYNIKNNSSIPKEFTPIKINSNLSNLEYYLDTNNGKSNTYASIELPKKRSYISKFYKITGANLKKENIINLSNNTYKVDYSFLVTGYDNDHVFLKLDIVPLKTYLNGIYDFYILGKEIYSGDFKVMLANSSSTMYIPIENYLKVSKQRSIKKGNGNALSVKYSYNILNMVDFPLSVSLVELMPLNNSTYHVSNNLPKDLRGSNIVKLNNGKVIYNFTLNPSSKKLINYSYKVSKIGKI